MSGKKLAVMVVHGMGSQAVDKNKGEVQSPSNVPTFSKDLHKRIRKLIGTKHFDESVAWREVVWADVLQARQKEYLNRIKPKTRFDCARAFMLCNFSDASAYRKVNDKNDNTYRDIHDRVSKTLGELEGDVKSGAPVLVLAHSLGGHIMSNYMYDHRNSGDQKDCSNGPSRFQCLKSLGGFVTFGCNIPLFTFAYEPKDIRPVTFPGTDLPKEQPLRPWWRNFYDKDDVLGFPLRDISPSYECMFKENEMMEEPINVSGLFTSWNPFSHTAYWRSASFVEPTAAMIKKLLRQA